MSQSHPLPPWASANRAPPDQHFPAASAGFLALRAACPDAVTRREATSRTSHARRRSSPPSGEGVVRPPRSGRLTVGTCVRSNRSAAFLQLLKVQKALSDADMCIKLKPEWEKVRARPSTARNAGSRAALNCARRRELAAGVLPQGVCAGGAGEVRGGARHLPGSCQVQPGGEKGSTSRV